MYDEITFQQKKKPQKRNSFHKGNYVKIFRTKKKHSSLHAVFHWQAFSTRRGNDVWFAWNWHRPQSSQAVRVFLPARCSIQLFLSAFLSAHFISETIVIIKSITAFHGYHAIIIFFSPSFRRLRCVSTVFSESMIKSENFKWWQYIR